MGFANMLSTTAYLQGIFECQSRYAKLGMGKKGRTNILLGIAWSLCDWPEQ